MSQSCNTTLQCTAHWYCCNHSIERPVWAWFNR